MCVKSQESRQRPGYCNVLSKKLIPCIWYAACITGQTKEGLWHSQAYGMIKADPALTLLLLFLSRTFSFKALSALCDTGILYQARERNIAALLCLFFICECISMSSQVWRVTCARSLFTLSHFICTGASGWLEQFLSTGEGWWDPMPADAQWQLHQGHGRRRQRRLGLQPQALAQGPGAAGELPEGHTAVPHRDDHTQVSLCWGRNNYFQYQLFTQRLFFWLITEMSE